MFWGGSGGLVAVRAAKLPRGGDIWAGPAGRCLYAVAAEDASSRNAEGGALF